VTAAEQGLVAAFAPPAGEPAWLAEARRAALGRFSALGLPTTQHEDWRFTSLAGLAGLALHRAPPSDGARGDALLARAPAPEGARLVFVNGRFRPDLSSRARLPRAALLAPLAEVLRDAPERVAPHLGRLARTEDHAFVAANAALFEDGVFLELPAGVAMDAPIALVFLADGKGGAVAAHPRTLVVVGEGARAILEEVYVGVAGAPYLTNAVTELVLGAGSSVEHVRVQLEGDAAHHVSVVHAEQGAGASLAAHAFMLGGRVSRAEIRARLAGEGASVAANGLSMASGDQVVDNFSWVEHAVPGCTTAESFKGILDDRSRGVFAGRIRVLPGAQKTVARQMTSNLLLSDDAIVDAKPQLEIFADDVKCGHGGTVGQLDEAALFYLRSRGVGEAEARSLLIWAFASEMVGLVGAPALRARAKNVVAARLPSGARLLEAA
jgi:Fe-S cluster assembly protein SufD